MSYLLWTLQAALAVLFLAAGAMKLAMPLAEMEAQSGIPGAPIVVASVAEILGALGLLLPGLLRIRPELTPLAALGLALVMVGATATTAATMGMLPALFPFVTGLLALVVAYGRWRVAPHAGRAPAREPAR